MKIEDIKPIGKVIQTHPDFGTIESEVIQGITMLDVGTKLYTDEQMQEYAKAQAKKVFWNSVKGTSEDRVLLARSIDYVFKEAQDEEV